ncbi:MAG: transposase [Cyclobacteriaceae bacterium]
MISHHWRDELYKYITGIVQAHNHKMIIINGMPDHLQVLIGMRPTESVSDLNARY